MSITAKAVRWSHSHIKWLLSCLFFTLKHPSDLHFLWFVSGFKNTHVAESFWKSRNDRIILLCSVVLPFYTCVFNCMHPSFNNWFTEAIIYYSIYYTSNSNCPIENVCTTLQWHYLRYFTQFSIFFNWAVNWEGNATVCGVYMAISIGMSTDFHRPTPKIASWAPGFM